MVSLQGGDEAGVICALRFLNLDNMHRFSSSGAVKLFSALAFSGLQKVRVNQHQMRAKGMLGQVKVLGGGSKGEDGGGGKESFRLLPRKVVQTVDDVLAVNPPLLIGRSLSRQVHGGTDEEVQAQQ